MLKDGQQVDPQKAHRLVQPCLTGRPHDAAEHDVALPKARNHAQRGDVQRQQVVFRTDGAVQHRLEGHHTHTQQQRQQARQHSVPERLRCHRVEGLHRRRQQAQHAGGRGFQDGDLRQAVLNGGPARDQGLALDAGLGGGPDLAVHPEKLGAESGLGLLHIQQGAARIPIDQGGAGQVRQPLSILGGAGLGGDGVDAVAAGIKPRGQRDGSELLLAQLLLQVAHQPGAFSPREQRLLLHGLHQWPNDERALHGLRHRAVGQRRGLDQGAADHAILTLGIGRDNAGTGLVHGGLAARPDEHRERQQGRDSNDPSQSALYPPPQDTEVYFLLHTVFHGVSPCR